MSEALKPDAAASALLKSGGVLPLDAEESAALFAPLLAHRKVLIAISGGPDSTALALLAMRWRAMHEDGPDLIAATVDHRLRPDSTSEAEEVGRVCAGMGLAHHVLAWEGEKPAHGIQEAARTARYGLLLDLARKLDADALAVAHTRDDQAETVLFRLARGSGLSGLSGMKRRSARGEIALLRPLLDVPKARLVETLRAANVPFVQDPANANPRFARARLRVLAPMLAQEGLDAARLSHFARRMARADAALEKAVDEAALRLLEPARDGGMHLSASAFAALPEEIALRLLGRVIDLVGHEGPVELGKLETLLEAFSHHRQGAGRMEGASKGPAFRRTLAGALVDARRDDLWIFPAPMRRKGTIPPDSLPI